MNLNNPHYLRVKISGQLTVCSALHIGDGGMDELRNHDYPKAKIKAQDVEKMHYNTVCRDVEGKPYLPASSLRGFLAAIAQDFDAKLHQQLFGLPATPADEQANDDDEEQGQAGRLRIYDARLNTQKIPEVNHLAAWDAKKYTCLRSQVSIDPITGVSKSHQLFSEEYIPVGSVFNLELEIDQFSQADLSKLLGLLACWDGESPVASLGKARSKGQGQLKWALQQIETLNQEQLITWLNDKDAKSLSYNTMNPTPKPTNIQQQGYYHIPFKLYPTSRFLVNDPWLGAKTDPNDTDRRETEPARYSRYSDGTAIIPASTQKGWLRGHARRILLTILSENRDATKIADDFLDKLFGSTEQRSLIWLQDALANKEINAIEQTFIAVDRFTGGATDGALYQAESAQVTYFEGQIHLPMSLDKAYLGLLLLILRDIVDGDLVLGWGKGRGYGCFKLVYAQSSGLVQDTPWYIACQQVDAEDCLRALHSVLAT